MQDATKSPITAVCCIILAPSESPLRIFHCVFKQLSFVFLWRKLVELNSTSSGLTTHISYALAPQNVLNVQPSLNIHRTLLITFNPLCISIGLLLCYTGIYKLCPVVLLRIQKHDLSFFKIYVEHHCFSEHFTKSLKGTHSVLFHDNQLIQLLTLNNHPPFPWHAV